MKYTQVLVALLSSLSLLTPLHAGMQDRGYDEVLIDDVVHPHGGSIRLAVGPEGRLYLTYKAYNGYSGWVEAYSATGELQATIQAADIPSLAEGGVFSPEVVLPGAGGIFAILRNSGSYYDEEFGYEYAFDLSVFGSDSLHHREAHVKVSGYSMMYLLGGWIQSLDGSFVVFEDDGFNSGFNGFVFDSSGELLETNTYTFSIHDSSLLFIGYSVAVSEHGNVYEELTFDVEGTLLSRTEVESESPVYDQPRLENGQVELTRRAYRTKGDANAIPLPQILSVVQRPETTLIDITYRVDDADDDSVTVGILASMTDDQGQTSRIPLATLVEDSAANLGAGVPTNSERTVTWDAGVDWGAAFGDVSFDLYVNDGRPLLGFHLLTLPLPDGDLTISRSPVNDLELKEALYYLWATDQGVRLDANEQLIGQGGVFEGVLLGTPEAPITAASRSWVFHQLGLQEASAAQVEAARKGFDADTVYQFTPQHPIRGDLLNYRTLPESVNELGFDSGSSNSNTWWVVPAEVSVLSSSIDATSASGSYVFTILDPNNAGWSLSTSVDWLSVNGPTSGVGSASISLALAANADMQLRSASVEINGGAYAVNVTQAGDPDFWPDDFANRYALSGESGLIEVSNAGATLEDGEPSHHGGSGGSSLWFTFTAPASGELLLSTVGSNFDTFISVYAGADLSSLTLINQYDGGGEDAYHTEVATLTMAAAQTYQIAIGGWSGGTGDLAISYQFTANAE